MTSRDFCYWLQGYFELTEAIDKDSPYSMTPDQVLLVRRHLNMVFVHEIDPAFPADQQLALAVAHAGGDAVQPPKPTPPPPPCSTSTVATSPPARPSWRDQRAKC